MTLSNLGALVKGMSVTLREMFNPPATIQYRSQETVSWRFRGRHELKRHEDGLEKCIGCSLCAAACPADASMLTRQNRRMKAPLTRRPVCARYEINLIRCIFCGFCEEACPTGAIILEHDYELSYYNRHDAIITKDKLIVPPPSPDQDTPRALKDPGNLYSAIPPVKGGVEQ
jgi:NADH-quinone oxidoreductase subunit I